MRRITEMDTVQIEITNACGLGCSNCTRFCAHIRKPFVMDFETFKTAVDSMKGFPKMVGIMGGEPLLHPQFAQFCEYALSQIPREQLGLWSSFPAGKEHYREVICKTFGNLFVNDHTRNDIYHAPILVGAEECIQDEREMWQRIDACWIQNCWSAAINPRGAFFCEIAAAMSVLFDEQDDKAWKVEPGWWMRVPFHFTDQIHRWCRRCGCALPLGRRPSVDRIDDISPMNFIRLRDKSRRVRALQYKLHDCKFVEAPEPMAQYKEQWFRDKVAARYGIYLCLNDHDFLEPRLMDSFNPNRQTYFARLKERYGE